MYAILQEWDFKKLQITKVAAHQDTFDPHGAFEQWAFAHSSLADRAARLANLQRPAKLWEIHKNHALATDYAAFVSGTVQNVILRISRQVVQRERLRDEISLDGTEVMPERPVMCGPPPPWPGFVARSPLPITSTAKFGHRLVATITSWLTRCLQENLDDPVPVQWVSMYQLYLDYQVQTGELGPVYHSKRWIDTFQLPQFRLNPASFKRRSAWFGGAVRNILTDHGCCPSTAVTNHWPFMPILWRYHGQFGDWKG